jgi:hypothetical protein
MKQKLSRIRVFNLALFVLSGVNLVAILLAGEDPRFREALWGVAPAALFNSSYPDAWNKLIYDLNLASIVSLFFYWLIVRLPEHRKRARIKRSFKAQYAAFKGDCIEIFLMLADGSYGGGVPESLLDQKTFRDYFKTPTGDGQDRWGRVANNLEGYYLQLLLNRMEAFREEIVFVLNNLDIEADAPFEFAKNFSKTITSASILTSGYDKKSLLQFLWTVFTGWSFVTRYPESDIVEDMIRDL